MEPFIVTLGICKAIIAKVFLLRNLYYFNAILGAFYIIHTIFPQPGDDIVFMAQTLEKVFLQKLSKMPEDECEVASVLAKEPLKGKKINAAGPSHYILSYYIIIF